MDRQLSFSPAGLQDFIKRYSNMVLAHICVIQWIKRFRLKRNSILARLFSVLSFVYLGFTVPQPSPLWIKYDRFSSWDTHEVTTSYPDQSHCGTLYLKEKFPYETRESNSRPPDYKQVALTNTINWSVKNNNKCYQGVQSMKEKK